MTKNTVKPKSEKPRINLSKRAIAKAANDRDLRIRRHDLPNFSSGQLTGAGEELHLLGHIVGSDRARGESPFGHGSGETVAISVLLRIAGELMSSIASLFADGRQYAAAALLRQLVEIEYLAWAFETRNRDG